MKLSVAAVVVGAFLIVSGVLLMVMSASPRTETVREIQIDVQDDLNGTYVGSYYFGAREDVLLINVNASESDAFLCIRLRD